VSESIRVMVASAGWPGHLFPVLALGRELRGRGHSVLVETWERWRDVVEGHGMDLSPAAESFAFPGVSVAPEPGPDSPTIAEVARSLLPVMREFRPDVVVSDLFTLAPSLAAEVAGLRRASVIHHPYPVSEPGLPYFLLGLLPPRTPLGAAAWRIMARLEPLLDARLRSVRRGLDATRAELGLPPADHRRIAVSDGLAMVATFPQLEYPRRWPPGVHVTGPMLFDLAQPDLDLPEGEEPLVLAASSTGQDPERSLLRIALDALEREPVRVIATLSERGERWSGPVPANATVLDWVSYRQVMPLASAVICRGGAGTVAQALAAGVPTLVCPAGGDMAENGARVTWAGAGLMVPQSLLARGPLRWATRRLLGDESFSARAAEIAAWGRSNDGAARGADLVERYARRHR
jgi:UDP:flavonoid glycosyltransferase YjiC (YdhE family)